jgi:hypothetical protein
MRAAVESYATVKSLVDQARSQASSGGSSQPSRRPSSALGSLQATAGNAALSWAIARLSIQRSPPKRLPAGKAGGAVLALGRWQNRVLSFGGMSIPLSPGAAKEHLANEARAAFPGLDPVDVGSLSSVAGDKRAPVTSAEHGGAWATLADWFEHAESAGVPRGARGLPSAVAVDEALEGAITVGGRPVRIRGIYLDATGVQLLDDFHTPAEYRRIVTALASGGNSKVEIVIRHGASGEHVSRIPAGARTVKGAPLPAEMRGPLVQGGWTGGDFLVDQPPPGAGAGAMAGERAALEGHGVGATKAARVRPPVASGAAEMGSEAVRVGRWGRLGRAGRLLAEGILLAVPDIALQIIMYKLQGQLDDQEQTNLGYGWKFNIAPHLEKYVESQEQELIRREARKLERCYLTVEFDVEYRAADKFGGFAASPGPYLYERMAFKSARLATEKSSSHKLVAESKPGSWFGPKDPMPFKTYRIVTSILLIEAPELLKFERDIETRGYGGGRQYGRIPES